VARSAVVGATGIWRRSSKATCSCPSRTTCGRGCRRKRPRTAALIRLGGIQAVTERHRDQRTIPLIAALRQDLR
jgi:hypothetical protein